MRPSSESATMSLRIFSHPERKTGLIVGNSTKIAALQQFSRLLYRQSQIDASFLF
jgi:hypothetical protein